MKSSLTESIKHGKEKTYGDAMKNLANDFNQGMITFSEFERAKKDLHKDIFGY